MPIKVCHLTSAHDSNDSRIFQRECVSVAANDDFDVYLVAPGESYNSKTVKVVGIGEKPSSRIERMTKFPKRVFDKAIEIDADIYHFHDPELLGVGKKLKKRGKKVIFDSHESTVDQIRIKPYLPKFMRGLIAKAYDFYEREICLKLDAVIFPCLVNEKNPFEKKAKRTIFLNNLPFLSEFQMDDTCEKLFDVCVIGSLTESRGITYLLQACKKVNATIALGGDFETEEYMEQLQQQGLLDSKFVNYFGFCDRLMVRQLYLQSKLCVSNILPVGQYPIAGNLPTKVYECMAMKMPIIISNFDYPVKLNAIYNFAICVDPENVDEISGAISELLSNQAEYTLLGQNGRSAIENEFNWEKESIKLLELYRELYEEI